MSPEERMKRVRRANDKVDRAEHSLHVARERLRDELFAARDEGFSLAELGKILGITRARVHQLTSEEQRGDRPRPKVQTTPVRRLAKMREQNTRNFGH